MVGVEMPVATVADTGTATVAETVAATAAETGTETQKAAVVSRFRTSININISTRPGNIMT